MSLDYNLMVWDPDLIGCRDDSFKDGGWDPIGYDCDPDQIDGDYVELTVRAGKLTGYIEKWGINFDLADYPYLVLGLWGDDDYWVQIWDGAAWLNAVLATASPSKYGFRVHYLGGLAPAGNITAIRIGVGSAAGKVCTYDFFEFHSRVPWFPHDVINGRVAQRELEADFYELNVIKCGIVDTETVLLLQMDENLGPKAFDDSGNESDGVITGADWDTGGEFDNCLKFVRANNDIVTISDADELSIDETGEMTWDFYFKLSSDGILQYIFGKGAAAKWEYIMRVNLDNTITFIVYQLGGAVHLEATSINAVVDGKWYHAIVTAKENDSLYVYIDRVLWASDLVSSGAIGNEDQDLILGRQGSVAANYLDARLDVFRMVNRVYTPIERKRSFDCSNVSAKKVYVSARCIRIVMDNGTLKDKIFAGYIEEAIPDLPREKVTGRCFQVKIQKATKTVEFTENEVSDAVETMVEDIAEITLGRVKTPAPQIDVTLHYTDKYLSDGLDELTSLPSKQAPFDAWRWKLGYGQDLRFRSILDADVITCATSITEGTNLLNGIKKAADIYELANKVKVISGPVVYPHEQDWTQDHANWAIDWSLGCVNCALGSGTTAGHDWITVACDTLSQIRVDRTIPAIDLTDYKRVRVWLYRNEGVPSDTNVLYLKFGTDNNNCWTLEVQYTTEVLFWEIKETVDFEYWSKVGNPDITNVTWIAVYIAWPGRIGNVRWSDWQFVSDALEAEAEDVASIVGHDRTLVYKDAKIERPSELQDFADGLIYAMKEGADRTQLPVVGSPDFKRGQKVTVDSPSLNMDANYIIIEADHMFGRGVGYITTMLLSSGRFNLAMELARTLQSNLRREEMGAVKIQ